MHVFCIIVMLQMLVLCASVGIVKPRARFFVKGVVLMTNIHVVCK